MCGDEIKNVLSRFETLRGAKVDDIVLKHRKEEELSPLRMS